ncbi:hypothetical protein JXL21_10190 [Candidatus Bathyarchaeota archaeon]|nr:hypothetical protein [Candidatus Bathyarchaeota archaeon]
MTVMGQERTVRGVEITVLVHATEDESKVRKAVLNLFPAEVETPVFEATGLKGYFGEPITTLKVTVKHRRPATDLFDRVVLGLSSLDLQALLDELPQRIDETNNLYIRLDKQGAYLGKVRLEGHDAIRFKAKLHLPHKADPVEYMHEYIESVTE